jgi:GrpB-like predicted nucleotidyltransferase (UPF0157 family)
MSGPIWSAARDKPIWGIARRLHADTRLVPADMKRQGRKDIAAMPSRLDIPTLLQHARIPGDADEATLRRELERRGWRVQVEELLRDDVLRQRGGHGNRYRALAFRTHHARPASAFHFADYRSQQGASAEEALRKLLATLLHRTRG